MLEEDPPKKFTKAELSVLSCWAIWLIAWLLEPPIHRHDFNTAQWLLHSWWFIQEPWPTCLESTRLSCWYYPSHPPLIHIIGVPTTLLFGWQTWPLRLIQASLVLWGALELRALVRRKSTVEGGTMALVLILASPVMIGFAAIPNYEPTIVALLCVLLNRVSHYIEHPSMSRGAIVILVSVLGMLTDWSAYHPVGVAWLIAWWGYKTGSEQIWVSTLAKQRWVLTGLVCVGIAIVLMHLWMLEIAHGSSQILFDTAEKRSFGRPPLMILQYLAIIISGTLALMLPIWIVFVLCQTKSFPNADVKVGFWLIIPLSAGCIHTLMFLQGASRHEYWTAPLLPPLALAAAISSSNWTKKQIHIASTIGCAALLIWGLGLLQTTPSHGIKEKTSAVEGLEDIWGDDASLLVSDQIINGRPEVVATLHTGYVTPVSWTSNKETSPEWDGALLCENSEWANYLFSDSQNWEILELRNTPDCEGNPLLIMIPPIT